MVSWLWPHIFKAQCPLLWPKGTCMWRTYILYMAVNWSLREWHQSQLPVVLADISIWSWHLTEFSLGFKIRNGLRTGRSDNAMVREGIKWNGHNTDDSVSSTTLSLCQPQYGPVKVQTWPGRIRVRKQIPLPPVAPPLWPSLTARRSFENMFHHLEGVENMSQKWRYFRWDKFSTEGWVLQCVQKDTDRRGEEFYVAGWRSEGKGG